MTNENAVSRAKAVESSIEITDIESWKTLASDVVARCIAQGATAADAAIGSSKGFQINVRCGEIETLEFNRDKGLSLTVYRGQKSGSVSLSDLRHSAIAEAINKALAIAEFTGEDPFAGLADKALMATHYPSLDIYHPWDISTDEAIQLATACESEAMAYDKRIKNSEGVGVSTHQGIHVYANSHGFAGAYCKTSHSISCSLVGEFEGKMQSNGDYTSARDANELISISKLARSAAERTVSRLGARSIPTGRYPVVFHATVAKSLIGHLVQAASGGSIYRRSTFLVDKLGQAICHSRVTISENPHLLKAAGSAPFDAEGVLTTPRTLVEKGVLQHYILSSYSGRQLGMPTTANAGGVRNLSINYDDKSFDELLAEMGDGLLVMELMGQGVNIVTGDYSRGAAGFWVEKGKIAYPVEEITIASHLSEMFMQIQSVANDVDTRGNVRTGSILIESMMVAGAGA
ncbi:MAG: metalloprotease PmbA [Legionellales bacterium]|nr:metalloprotease PmbA [Legionellales bacterium]